jgi:hypothetical protein
VPSLDLAGAQCGGDRQPRGTERPREVKYAPGLGRASGYHARPTRWGDVAHNIALLDAVASAVPALRGE